MADFRSIQPSTEPSARYRFQTTGAVGFLRDVVIGDQENLIEEAKGEPTATFTCGADYLALLVWGRLKPGDLLADGRLMISPGTGTGKEFAAWLSR